MNLIHKPPASNSLAPIEHALAVTVELFKFSPPVAYEYSNCVFWTLGVKSVSAGAFLFLNFSISLNRIL
jgi:hypothetical protein